MIDTIAFNDVQRYFKKTVKTETGKYTEYSSEFWPYRLIQIISKLPESYKHEFMSKYKVSEEKLDAVLAYVDKSNNQRLYKLLYRTLAELRTTYAAI